MKTPLKPILRLLVTVTFTIQAACVFGQDNTNQPATTGGPQETGIRQKFSEADIEWLRQKLFATNSANTNIEMLKLGDSKTIVARVIDSIKNTGQNTQNAIFLLDQARSNNTNASNRVESVTARLTQGIADLISSNLAVRPYQTKQLVESLDEAVNTSDVSKRNEAVKQAAERLELLLKPEPFTPKAFLHLGYVTLNPYTFKRMGTNDGDDWRLESDDLTSAFYVEFQYNNRWAWNWDEAPPSKIGEWDGVNPFRSGFDFQTRFGYSFVNSDPGENTSKVSSVVGGGNVSGEVTIGVPFAKFQNDWLRSSVNWDISYGMTSDREDFDIHSTLFAGFGYYASIKSGLFPSRVLLSTRLGWAMTEVPEIIDEDIGTVANKLNRPKFTEDFTTVAFTTEVMLPLTESVYVLAGARLHANSDPNPWTAYIGISTALTELRDSVFGKTKEEKE